MEKSEAMVTETSRSCVWAIHVLCVVDGCTGRFIRMLMNVTPPLSPFTSRRKKNVWLISAKQICICYTLENERTCTPAHSCTHPIMWWRNAYNYAPTDHKLQLMFISNIRIGKQCLPCHFDHSIDIDTRLMCIWKSADWDFRAQHSLEITF